MCWLIHTRPIAIRIIQYTTVQLPVQMTILCARLLNTIWICNSNWFHSLFSCSRIFFFFVHFFSVLTILNEAEIVQVHFFSSVNLYIFLSVCMNKKKNFLKLKFYFSFLLFCLVLHPGNHLHKFIAYISVYSWLNFGKLDFEKLVFAPFRFLNNFKRIAL